MCFLCGSKNLYAASNTDAQFDDFIDEKYRGVNLYPEELRSQIDDACTWQHEMINKGVYKCGVATTAEDYERHVHALFKALDRVEKHLMEQNCGPYYFGKMLTEVDIRLSVLTCIYTARLQYIANMILTQIRHDYSVRPCLCPALQVQHLRYSFRISCPAQVAAQLILEAPGIPRYYAV